MTTKPKEKITLQGEIHHVTYRDERTGYSVVRLNVPNLESPVTAVGIFPFAAAGETVSLSGEWVVHPRFGRQFKVQSCFPVVPASAAGIERYLGGGSIKGIGPVTADRKSVV